MTTIRNDTAGPIDITFHVEAAHYEPSHACEGSCRTRTIQVQLGTLFTFDNHAENAGDVETALAAHGLT